MEEGSYRLHHGNEKQKLTLTTENSWLVCTKFVLEENDFVCEYAFASSSEAMTQGDDIRERTELETCHPRAKILRSTESSLFLHNFCTFAYEKGGDIPMTPTPSSCFLVTRHHIHPATSRKREQGRSQATSSRRNGCPKYSVENGTTGSQVLRTPTHERVRLA